MPPKISIIIPCYNVADYLSSCLHSISIQQMGEVEYVFVDDGSKDSTLEMLKEFCKERNDCKLIHQQNSGVSAARNTALKVCSGDFIYLLDGDDILIDQAINKMLETIKSYACDAVVSSIAIKNANEIEYRSLSIPEGLYSPGELFSNCSVFPLIPQLLYKRSIITENNLMFDISLNVGEVYDFTIKFLSFAKKIAVTSDYYFYYVMRSSSATHNPDLHRDLTVIKSIEKYYEYGEDFIKYPSFNITAFKMMMSFTYNKYAKLHLRNKRVYEGLKILLSNSTVRKCMRNVIKEDSKEWRERLFAAFVLMTGVNGYKFLTKII